jgi:hypothetical protein
MSTAITYKQISTITKASNDSFIRQSEFLSESGWPYIELRIRNYLELAVDE